MADIFVSYASADRDKVRKLAAAIETHGWSVWWDRNIRTAQRFDEIIERELNDARCVLVCWSKKALESDYVRGEADEARQQRKVVPVKIEDVRLPFAYRGIHYADLTKWTGKKTHPEFQNLIASIGSMLNSPEADRSQAFKEAPREWNRRRFVIVGGVAGGVSVGAGVIFWLRSDVWAPVPREDPLVPASPPLLAQADYQPRPRFVPDDVKQLQKKNRHQQMPPGFPRGFYLNPGLEKTVHYVNRDGLALYANGLTPEKLEPVDPIHFASIINPPALITAVEEHILFLLVDVNAVKESLVLLETVLTSTIVWNHPSRESPSRLEDLFAELSLRFEGGERLRNLIDDMRRDHPESAERLSWHLQKWEGLPAQERRKPFRWIQPAICISRTCEDVDALKARITV